MLSGYVAHGEAGLARSWNLAFVYVIRLVSLLNAVRLLLHDCLSRFA